LATAGNAMQVWEGMDLARKRAIFRTLMTTTLH
jgi:hypothetical protein